MQLHFQFCDGTITPSRMNVRSQTKGRGHTALANFLCDDSMSTSSVDCTAFRLVRALASGLQTSLNSDQPVHQLPGRSRTTGVVEISNESVCGLPQRSRHSTFPQTKKQIFEHSLYLECKGSIEGHWWHIPSRSIPTSRPWPTAMGRLPGEHSLLLSSGAGNPDLKQA